MTYDITLVVTVKADNTDEALVRVGKNLLGDDRILDFSFENAKAVR